MRMQHKNATQKYPKYACVGPQGPKLASYVLLRITKHSHEQAEKGNHAFSLPHT